MIIVLEPKIKKSDYDEVISYINNYKLTIHTSQGDNHIILGLVGDTSRIDVKDIAGLNGVRDAFRVSESYKLCSRTFHPQNTVIDVGNVRIGDEAIVMIAGPCSVENREMLIDISEKVYHSGTNILRGGAFKPRSSPYTFQGLGAKGLEYLREAADKHQMPVVSEIMDENDIELFCEFVDIIQVGARNMYNYTMLKKLASIKKPIILKRGLSATIEEWLNSAEYIVSGGNSNVILCERGFRTFEKTTRFTLDLSSVPVLKRLTHLPIIVDPSHAMGNRNYVLAMSRAAVAAGADGIMIEVHQNPDKALSDGPQSLYPHQFTQLMGEIDLIARAIGRRMHGH
jgi:3-deoxy-7-phosphoheptulonate synthase